MLWDDGYWYEVVMIGESDQDGKVLVHYIMCTNSDADEMCAIMDIKSYDGLAGLVACSKFPKDGTTGVAGIQ